MHKGRCCPTHPQLRAQAGVPELRCHDRRYSCATLLLAACIDLKTTSPILGYSQISVTAGSSGHVTTAMAQPALEQLDALLSH